MKKGDIVEIIDKKHTYYNRVFCIMDKLNEKFGLSEDPKDFKNLVFVDIEQIKKTKRSLPFIRKISPDLDAYKPFGIPDIKPSDRGYGLLFE